MKRSTVTHLLLTILLVSFSIPMNAQFITLARKIKGMHGGDNDVATVILDAHTFRVYQAVVDTLSSSKVIKDLTKDPVKRAVVFNNGKSKITLKVDSLETKLCQITVLAPHQEEQQKKATDQAVETILMVSKKLGIPCTVDKH